MGNEFRGLLAHSAEYFGEVREHWWNEDFLGMLAARWRKDELKRAIDVGCGVGHWGRALAKVLPNDLTLVGIDRESVWVEKATERAKLAGLDERFSYRQSTVESMPFETGSFDLVTCQTLLMHVPSPARALAEMVRVLRPGGLLVAAEPTNLAPVLIDSVALANPPEITTSLLRLQLECLKGKALLGEGNDAIGESLPSLLVEAGLCDVEVRNNDKVAPMVPPYESVAERAQIEEADDATRRKRFIWDEPTARRYFDTAGGTDAEFEALWRIALDQNERVLAAMRARTFTSAGGSFFYVAWGRKPS
jgi:SAM-dependent methyltransferase